MRILGIKALALAALLVRDANADVVVLEPIQVGGFYAGGAAPDNLVTFQNYFVGYGTSAGGMRSPERRSFFWFNLAGVSGTVHSATLSLDLIFGGLVFGKGPGVPGVDPIMPDPFETFQLGFTGVPVPFVTSTSLTPGMAAGIFDDFDSMPIAAPLTFVGGMGPPPTVIPLDATGLALLAAHPGGDVILTGWMPTWTDDSRIEPGSMPPEPFEGSELIFGHTNVHLGFPTPKLTIEFTPVPEIGAWAMPVVGGAVAVALRRLRRAKPLPLS